MISAESTPCPPETSTSNRGGRVAPILSPGYGKPSQEQPHGLDEDGLPRAGFARQYVQTGVEFDLDRVDHGEMPNTQKAEHGEMARTPIVT